MVVTIGTDSAMLTEGYFLVSISVRVSEKLRIILKTQLTLIDELITKSMKFTHWFPIGPTYWVEFWNFSTMDSALFYWYWLYISIFITWNYEGQSKIIRHIKICTWLVEANDCMASESNARSQCSRLVEASPQYLRCIFPNVYWSSLVNYNY